MLLRTGISNQLDMAMMDTKFEEFSSATRTCKWLNEHPNIHIIAITQAGMWYTIFYKEYTDEDYARETLAAIDPHFGVPTDRIVQPVGTAPSVRKDAVPQPTVVC